MKVASGRPATVVILGAVFVLVVAGIALLVGRDGQHWNVRVTIRNADSVAIESIALKHEHGTVIVRDLEPGSSREMGFTCDGESGYTLEAKFRGGPRVSGGNYVEPGYGIVEVATRKGVMTEKYF